MPKIHFTFTIIVTHVTHLVFTEIVRYLAKRDVCISMGINWYNKWKKDTAVTTEQADIFMQLKV